MTPLLSFSLVAALLCFAVAIVLALPRLLRGPAAQDRILALDFIAVNAMLIVLVLTVALMIYRYGFMKHTNRSFIAERKKSGLKGYDHEAFWLALRTFGTRLLATSGTWCLNDILFYGNKLFQGKFIAIITDNPSSVMVQWQWNLYNTLVSLAGYYTASMLMDNKLYGRRTMQMVGFLVCVLTFAIPAIWYDYFTSPSGIRAFQALYFISSFFNQFGPNSVTFLVAGEVFPIEVRASFHGIGACIGKAGALLPAVLYNYIPVRTKFYLVPCFGIAGMVLNHFFLPDTTGLDLAEQQRWWRKIKDGREEEYHGVAIHPRHLSWWERHRHKLHLNYDPKKDVRDKIEEMRALWQKGEADRLGVDGESGGGSSGPDDFTEEMKAYFIDWTEKGKAPSTASTQNPSPVSSIFIGKNGQGDFENLRL